MSSEALLERNYPDEAYDWMELGEPYEGVPYFPCEAYDKYLQEIRKSPEKPKLYVSMAITSGGYKLDETLEIPEVIDKNTGYGSHLREFFTEQGISPNTIIIPSELGGMRQAAWGQLDFLMLWFHIMSGISAREAYLVESEMRNRGAYQDAKWAQKEMLNGTPEKNWGVYERFTREYAAVLKDIHCHPEPMEAVIGALDPEMSLGGRSEALLAELLEIPYYTMDAHENAVSPEFREEIDYLTFLGAKAINLYSEEGPRFFFRPVYKNKAA